jgi:hypothetical protein
MRSPRAASAAAKLLIFLALGALAPMSASEAATKCPSGQILRVSLGVCVPKAQNLAILSRHGSRNAKPAQETARLPAGPKQGQDAMANSDELGEPSVDVAQRETLPSADQPAPRPSPQAGQVSSPFGSLFVGAFRSTVSAGLSAFR